MKLILTREVAGLGQAGDVVTVKDGFGRNYLLPRGNAITWSQGGEKQIEGIRRARAAREIRDIDHANSIKATLEAATLTIKVKVGTGNRLFGSVTDKDVAAAIKKVIHHPDSINLYTIPDTHLPFIPPSFLICSI